MEKYRKLLKSKAVLSKSLYKVFRLAPLLSKIFRADNPVVKIKWIPESAPGIREKVKRDEVYEKTLSFYLMSSKHFNDAPTKSSQACPWEIQEKHIVMVRASHFYATGAALYYTILYGKDPKLYWEIVETFMKAAAEAGATLSHHHGVGMLKRKWLTVDPGLSTIILNKIKEALDSKNVLNSNITQR